MMNPSLILLTLAFAVAPDDSPVLADLVLRGGTIHDGSGGPPVQADLAVRGDRIVAIGKFQTKGKPVELDVSGLILAPGFIDLHSHSDYPLQNKVTRANLAFLYQGATTVITGNCGAGPLEVGKYFASLEKGKIGTNVIHLVPHNSVRRSVMGNSNRVPSEQELKQMKALVDKGMKEGAWGLATGLIYNPGTYSKTDELIELARVAGKHKGIYASHIRDEGVGVLTAIDEALRIGKAADIPVHISHLKASGRRAWGKSADIIGLLTKARAEGQKVTADQYPYPASSTSLSATVIPPRYREGTAADFQKRLADKDLGPQIRKAIKESVEGRDGGKAIRIARYTPKPVWQGKDLAAIAALEKKPLLDLVLEIEKNGGAQIVNFSMNEEDVRLIMKAPFVATASDGSSQNPKSNTVPHPRSYGTFPRKIGRYALQDRIVKIEHAIRSATGLPADILHLPERGYLRKGYYADIVVFDPKTFRDVATYDKPHQFATGVKYLFVNGKAAIKEEKHTEELAGRVLRHASR